MRILSWNINGVRASGRVASVRSLLDSLETDVICLQETKVSRDQLDEPTAIVEGYVSFFTFCKTKKQGYSGVATYTKLSCCPVLAEEGVAGILAGSCDDIIGCYGNMDLSQNDLAALDLEGRTVMTEHKLETGESLVIINVYCPRASVSEDGGNSKRMDFKMMFHRMLSERCHALISAGKHVLLLGDMNAIHQSIDCCEPEMMTFESSFGERWMNELIKVDPSEGPGLLVDCFRQFHPTRNDAFTCWATITSARETNYGRRLDYILASPEFFLKHVMDADILPHIQGSDHCPVVINVNVSFSPPEKPPSLCTQYLPEFSGRQQKLTSFLMSAVKGHGDAMTIGGTSQNCRKRKDSSDSGRMKQGKQGKQESQAKLSRFLPKSVSDSRMKKTEVTQETSLQGKQESQAKLSRFLPKSVSDSRMKKTEVTQETSLQGKQESQAKLSRFLPKSVSDSRMKKTEVTQETSLPTSHGSTQPDSSMISAQSDSTSTITVQTASTKSIVGDSRASQAQQWRSLLKGPAPPPLCKGHREPCVLRTVKKIGANQHRQFYVCARPQGLSNDPKARCDHFEWASGVKMRS